MSNRQRKLVLIMALACAAVLALCLYGLRDGRGKAQESPAAVSLPSSQPARAPEDTAAASPKPVSAAAEAYGDIVISELMEKNRAVLRDCDGDFSDWIELYNSGTVPVSLSGWTIDDEDSDDGWPFPDIVIGAGERLLVFASGKNRAEGELHTDFSVSASDTVYLKNPKGKTVSSAAAAGCKTDMSMALLEDGSFAGTLYPTPGFPNTAAGYAAFQDSLAVRGPLAVTEVMVTDRSVLKVPERENCDWVEIGNVSSESVSLAGWSLYDSGKNCVPCALPDISLAPGETLLVLCGSGAAEYDGRYAYADFALDGENEQLFLSRGDELMDFISLRDIPFGCSFGRLPGCGGGFFFASPTPGAPNSEGRRRVGEKPVALTKDGVFDGVESVVLELSGSGTLRYTLDGSAPNASSEEYTGPLSIGRTCVVRVCSFEEDALPSRPLTLNYIVNEGHSLPVMCLATDDPLDFSRMYNGPHKGFELPSSLSLYEKDSSFTIPCGVSLNGETSLIMPKKNMSVRFRAAYGESRLKYDIYKDGGPAEFENLLLRAGQDQERAIIRNELAQSLAQKAGCRMINQRSIYTVLYINGEYRGIYTLKEKTNEALYAILAGVAKSSVELEEADIDYYSPLYQDVIRFAIMNDMSLPENYARICELVNIDSLIDWVFFEGFTANTDLTRGNARFVRSPEADGKWNFMFYDLDATFNNLNSMYLNLMTEYSRQNSQISSLILPLMKNAEFKDAFLTRAHELLRDELDNDTVLAELDRLADEIRPEVARDLGRFTRDASEWEWNVSDLRSFIDRHNWRQENIEKLCFVFELTDAEREHYFGDIDGK